MTEYRLHGPPGTGKTWTLATKWVPRAVERFGAHRVVICSLTKAAASVIGGRNTGVPRENIGTLHALCYRALGRPPIAEAHLEEWNEENPALAITRDGGGSVDDPLREPQSALRGDELMAESQVQRHRQSPAEGRTEALREFEALWQGWMDETGYLDFTGLIETCLRDIDDAPGSPAVFIVDEAQDCSALELALIRKWARGCEYLVLAGDGDQAIYEWRGASPEAFLAATIPAEHNYHLERSFRIPSSVHEVATRWIERCSSRYPVAYRPREEQGEVIHANALIANLPMPLVQYAERAMEEGTSLMVLASCSYQLKPTIKLLRANGIPFHNPYRRTNGAWNPLRGAARRVSAFLLPSAAHFGKDARQWGIEDIAAWTEHLKANALGERGFRSRLAITVEHRRHENRVEEPVTDEEIDFLFGSVADELRAVIASGDPLKWFESRVLASKAASFKYALEVVRRRGGGALRNRPNVIVGTIHSTKGGEADDVVLFPDLSSSGMREWTNPGPTRDAVLRTFYVGMTRCRRKLYLCGRSSGRAVTW
jgi:DNA helicase-2/ATP-dependent DNA helicase PcrA